MNSARDFMLVLVTTPDVRTARKLVRIVLEKRAAACANLIPRMESHYWWRGKIESNAEVLIIFKTPGDRLAALEKLVLTEHPYDTPEIVALELKAGTKKYLSWIRDSTRLEQS